MTNEYREILIGKMVDSPSLLTDEELEIILHDSELREIYNISLSVSNTYAHKKVIDINKEWEIFRPLIRPERNMSRWCMKIAAIFLGILFLSSIVVKLNDKIFTNEVSENVTKRENTKHNENIMNNGKIQPLIDTPDLGKEKITSVSIKTEEFKMDNVGETNNKSHSIQSTSKPANKSFDIDEYLRIQEAKIENELALINAENYEDEYRNIKNMIDFIGIDKENFDNALKMVTMQ